MTTRMKENKIVTRQIEVEKRNQEVIKRLNAKVSELIKKGESIDVTNPETCLEAKSFEVECKSYEKAVDLYADGDITDAKERLSKLQTAKKMLLIPMQAILVVVRAKRRAWEEVERREAEKEQANINKKSDVPLQVKPAIPSLPGVRSFRQWKFKIVNEARIPRKYLIPDEAAIGKMVREFQDKEQAERECPGIEVRTE